MSVSRSARKAQRERALNPRPGRKAGAVPLRKHKLRFETAIFRTMRIWAPTMPQVFAAEIGVSFHDSIEISIIEKDGLVGLSFNYTDGRGEIICTRKVNGRVKIEYDPELRTSARSNRREKLLRDAPKLIEQAQGKDRLWLEASTHGLLGLIDAMTTLNADPDVARYAIRVLAAVDEGWPRRLARLNKTHS